MPGIVLNTVQYRMVNKTDLVLSFVELMVSSRGKASINNHKIKYSITNRNKIMKKKYRDCLESMLVAVVIEGQYFASAFLSMPMITPCNSLVLRWLY